jgi:energy-coupling factor transporter ATP-binding protein EcfA2
MELLLFVGPSGSGKTTLAKRLLERQGKPIYAVDDKTGQLGESYRSCTWEQVGQLKSCCVLVDDLIATSPSQFVCLQNLLCYAAAHSDVSPVVICTHIVNKNNISGLLSSVKKIVFTPHKANVRSLATVLSHFKFDQKTRREMEERFLSSSAQYGQFTLDLEARTLVPEGLTSDPSADSTMEGLPKEAAPLSPSRMLTRSADPEAANLLFEFVWDRIPKELKLPDYCVGLRVRITGEKLVINFVDFIFLLVDPDAIPTREMSGFYKYVNTLMNVPRSLINNTKIYVEAFSCCRFVRKRGKNTCAWPNLSFPRKDSAFSRQ